MSVVYPAAKPAVVALDAIERYAENGWDGAGYAVLFDLTLAIGGKLQENLKEARMMRGIDKSSECDIIEFPESPLENTNKRYAVCLILFVNFFPNRGAYKKADEALGGSDCNKKG